MLCEIGASYGFVALWVTMTVSGFVSMIILSSILFYPLYVKPTFEIWKWKSNPKFPSPALVKKEIVQMTKGLAVATLCPAIALMASGQNYDTFGFRGYCGDPLNYGIMRHLWQAFIIIAFTEFYEYGYHWLGHRFAIFWTIHRHHHSFYNPSPFAVIADEWTDQLVRTWPMIILPLLLPINMDLLFGIFASLFYGYGVYLHSGYEWSGLSAHNPIFNTSYHHYTHHAISAIGRPIYTGFFVKLCDWLFSTTYDKCSCVECRPKRTLEEWKETEKPDYSVLLQPSYWLKDEVPLEFLNVKIQ